MTDAILPKVSLIILNWNGGDDSRQCAECCVKQTYTNIELIVVDNGSTDHSLEYIATNYPQAIIVRNGTNLGFARGMNIGIAHSTGKYVVPLNQDAFLTPTFVSSIVPVMEDNIRAGAASAYVLPTKDVQNTYRLTGERGYSLKRHMRGHILENLQNPSVLLGPSGCCPFFRREMLEDIALNYNEFYDETYGTGGEDLELYIRMQLRGWTCLHVPDAKVFHAISGSVGGKVKLLEKPLWYQRNVLRNRYLTILSDLPLGVLLRISPNVLLYEVAAILYLLLASPKSLWALVLAWVDTLSHFDYMARKRRFIQSRKRISNQKFMQYFTAP